MSAPEEARLTLARGLLLTLEGQAPTKGAVANARSLLESSGGELKGITLSRTSGRAKRGEVKETVGRLRKEIMRLEEIQAEYAQAQPGQKQAKLKKPPKLNSRGGKPPSSGTVRTADGKTWDPKQHPRTASGPGGGEFAKKGDGMSGSPDANTKEMQQRLQKLGYDVGPLDGRFGDKTQAALAAYQKQAKVGEGNGAAAGDDTIGALRTDSQKGANQAVKQDKNSYGSKGENGPRVQQLQGRLSELGYKVQKDGEYGAYTSEAVRSLQKDYGLKPTGEVDAATLSVMRNPPAKKLKDVQQQNREDAKLGNAQGEKPKGKGSTARDHSGGSGSGKGGSQGGSGKGDSGKGGSGLKGGDSLHLGQGMGEKADPGTKDLQKLLDELGYDLGEAGADGRFGPDTRKAVLKLQRRYGLKADGIVGRQTRALLQRLSKRHAKNAAQQDQLALITEANMRIEDGRTDPPTPTVGTVLKDGRDVQVDVLGDRLEEAWRLADRLQETVDERMAAKGGAFNAALARERILRERLERVEDELAESVATWDSTKHPRGRGARFVEVLGKLGSGKPNTHAIRGVTRDMGRRAEMATAIQGEEIHHALLPHRHPGFPAGRGRAPSEAMSPKMPAATSGSHLPQDHDRYFTKPSGSVEVPLDKLKPTRARPEGIANARGHMRNSYEGKGGKRKPLALRDNGDGTYDVLDGNSTYANAKENGWKSIRAQVVENKRDPQGLTGPKGKTVSKVHDLPNGAKHVEFTDGSHMTMGGKSGGKLKAPDNPKLPGAPHPDAVAARAAAARKSAKLPSPAKRKDNELGAVIDRFEHSGPGGDKAMPKKVRDTLESIKPGKSKTVGGVKVTRQQNGDWDVDGDPNLASPWVAMQSIKVARDPRPDDGAPVAVTPEQAATRKRNLGAARRGETGIAVTIDSFEHRGPGGDDAMPMVVRNALKTIKPGKSKLIAGVKVTRQENGHWNVEGDANLSSPWVAMQSIRDARKDKK